MVSTALTLASNGQYNLTVPKTIASEFGLSASDRLAAIPGCGDDRRPTLNFEVVGDNEERRSNHRSLNSQAKAADSSSGRQLTVRLPNQLARALLLTGGETVHWGVPDGTRVENSVTGGADYERLDADEPMDGETGVTKATLKAYGAQEQFRTYIPQLSVSRWEAQLPHGVPSHVAFRVECRDGTLGIVLDADHGDNVTADGKVKEVDALPGHPISLQSLQQRSQVNLNFPKQIAHALEVAQRILEHDEENDETRVEVTVVRWQLDPLNPQRLLGRLSSSVQVE